MTIEHLLYVCDLQGQAAEWIRILPLGRVELRDSRKPFEVKSSDMEDIIKKFRADRVDLVVDYQHQSLGDGDAPAAGWITDLEARADGLYSKVIWTPRALKAIQDGEFRYYSPVIKLSQPMELKHAALTNTPALKGEVLSPLLAAKFLPGLDFQVMAATVNPDKAALGRVKKYGIKVRPDGNLTKPGKFAQVPDEEWGDPVNYDYPMPDKAHCQNALSRWGDPKNSGQYAKAEQLIIEKRITSRAKAMGMQINQQEVKAKMLTQLKGILGLAAEAQETDVIAALKEVSGSATALKGVLTALGLEATAKPEEITAAITALKGDQGKLTALKTEVDALKDREVTRDAEAVVEVALKEGKLTPAERDLAVADAKRDPEGFKARLALRPRIVPIGDKLGVLKDGGNAADGEPGPEAPVDRRIAFKAQQLAAKDKIDLPAAQAQVLKDNPELAREYRQSFLVSHA